MTTALRKQEETRDIRAKEATIVARAAIEAPCPHGSVTPPLYLSTNYSFKGFGDKRLYDYSRSGNPTRDALGAAIAALECGHHAVVTGSGMAALDLAFHVVRRGELVVAPHDCYGGTHRLLSTRAARGDFRVKFADLTDTANLRDVFAEKTALVLIETPSNPLLRITDIAAAADAARKAGALVVADNTFLSPVQQKPLELGADVVVHSTTKYINGHGDVVGGAVVSATPELHEKMAWWANCVGSTGAPFDSFLTLRGLRSLPARLKQQTESAGKIAEFLCRHPAVAKTHYPGLEGHPGHDIAKRQQKGFGAMASFELKGGDRQARIFLDRLTGHDGRLFSLAESLGGYESLIAHPPTMTHAAMDPKARRAAGINDNLFRLSVGAEDADDLICALADALEGACR